MRYMVVIDRTPRNYCAFSPDVLGCIATGDTADEVTTLMREGIGYSLEDLVERGQPLPEPTSWAIEVKGYVVPISKTPNGYRAEPPDMPFVVAAADTRERVEALILETMTEYLAWHCKRPPEPTAQIVYVDVEAPQPVSA